MDWIFPSKVQVPDAFREAVGGDPLVADILFRRGITGVEQARAFLDPDVYTPTPPGEIPDLELAAERLYEGIQAGQRILVWGDFDVDGQTSTALLVDALRTLGAEAAYHVPHRMSHGHGVHTDILLPYVEEGYKLILTCDTGVMAYDAVDAAKAAGATMLVTDHHALGPALPDADAVVNPQRLPPGHPLRDLPGVGVGYKLVQALYAIAGRGGEAARFLDLVALGIVSDVATQQLDTRYLLQRGLDALRFPQRTGLKALMEAAQVDTANLSSDTIGFQIGPRLNALGRLDDARLAVELLTTDDMTAARQIAAQLEILNNQRKQIENQIYAAALEQIAGDLDLLKYEALVLGGQHWHPGVIGIVASRLVERYERPVILLAMPEGEPARGSARSVPGVDIGASIAAHGDMLLSQGGHPGAAGLAIEPDLIPQFRRRLSNTIVATRDPSAVSGRPIDAEIGLGQLSEELAHELDRLAPFGAGNPPVQLLTRDLRPVTRPRPFGTNRNHVRVAVEDEEGISFDITWWRGMEEAGHLPDAFDLVFIPRINDYKGKRSLQLEWVDYRPAKGIVVETGPRYEVIDLRFKADVLDQIPDDDVAIWVEGEDLDALPFDVEIVGARAALPEASSLAIWTIPPGPHEIEEALERSGARRIYVVGAHAPPASAEAFLKRLAGLAKYAMRVYDGKVSIPTLAGATGQREVTVRRGLEWVAARSGLQVEWIDLEEAQLAPDGARASDSLDELQTAIMALLAESAAYRAYFQQADLSAFFK